MTDGDNGAPTRRAAIGYGGAVPAGGLLAGCTGGRGDDGTPGSTPTGTATGRPGESGTGSTATGPDGACIEHAGGLTFEAVPETRLACDGGSNPATGEFYPLDTRGEGDEMKPHRDLDVESAFPDDLEGGQAGYETLPEVDPEILVVHRGIGTTGETDSVSTSAFRERYVTPMEEDSVGQQRTAVQEGRVSPGQYGEQGPLTDLLQTEMVAQQPSPAGFGAFVPGAFPDVPADRRLFDRGRVRDVIAGAV